MSLPLPFTYFTGSFLGPPPGLGSQPASLAVIQSPFWPHRDEAQSIMRSIQCQHSPVMGRAPTSPANVTQTGQWAAELETGGTSQFCCTELERLKLLTASDTAKFLGST